MRPDIDMRVCDIIILIIIIIIIVIVIIVVFVSLSGPRGFRTVEQNRGFPVAYRTLNIRAVPSRGGGGTH